MTVKQLNLSEDSLDYELLSESPNVETFITVYNNICKEQNEENINYS